MVINEKVFNHALDGKVFYVLMHEKLKKFSICPLQLYKVSES